jgi:SAM-dependent methyltransferase
LATRGPQDNPQSDVTPRSSSGRSLESLGQIQLIALERGGMVRIAGWSGSSRGGPTRLTVRCGDRTLPVATTELGLSTPETAQFVPHLANAATAGFRLRVRGVDGLDEVRGQLLRVTPVFGEEIGLDLMGVIAPMIEPPSPDELALVSQNLPVAFEFLAYFQELCGLARDARVLEVGCGVGRMAFALAHHLSSSGSYDGFDVVQRFIEIAAQRFRSLPHFRFKHENVANGEFNPDGDISAANLSFPYPDGGFDFVFLTSVFTHIRPLEVQHYIDEIKRVLRPGGRCLATAFLLDSEAWTQIGKGHAPLPLHPSGMGFFYGDPARPEAAIGYEETDFLRWWTERGFSVDSFLRGSWCGLPRFPCFQDIVIVSRR